MMITKERRKGARRVQFEQPLDARLMAIDGTWCRECHLIDVSETGARIELASPAAELKEFFLLLTKFNNPVFRRCERQWIDGTQMGVKFHTGPVGEKPLKKLRQEAQLV
jgi:hypothetical protein